MSETSINTHEHARLVRTGMEQAKASGSRHETTGDTKVGARENAAGDAERRLFVPLMTEPFLAFASGRKTVEVRQEGGRWTTGNVRAGRPVLLRRGYSTPDEITGRVGRVARADTYTGLPEWARNGAAIDTGRRADSQGRYFDFGQPVIAFEVVR